VAHENYEQVHCLRFEREQKGFVVSDVDFWMGGNRHAVVK